MTDHNRPEGWTSLGAAWRSDSVPAATFQTVDVGAVRARSAKFARKIRRRNVLEVLGATIVVAAGTRLAWTEARPLLIAGGVAMVLGALVVTAVILLRARNSAPPSLDAPTRDVLAYEQSELERQARLLERVWVWYLAPLLPGVVLVYGDELLRALERGNPYAIATSVTLLIAAVLGFVLIGRLNARSARRLRARARASAGADEAP